MNNINKERPSMSHTNRLDDAPFDSLSPPVWRASTVVFDNLTDFIHRRERQPDGYSYGTTGTPTARGLERRIAALEGGRHCVVTPSGQAALMITVMAFVRAGDHVLVSAACYGALQILATRWLARLGVEVELYRPDIGRDIAARLRPTTRMICLEAPGSITMEMPDVRAIAEVARERGVLTMIDNTWAGPLAFRPLEHGVDFCIEAATKQFGGHSDLLLGSVTTNDHGHYAALRETQSIFGLQASPDDCFLVLRGLETLKVRLAAQCAAALEVASWLESHPLVERVLFPALASDPGHALWKRDFSGGGSLFSLILQGAPEAAMQALFAALRCFRIGASWGGVHSLAAYYPARLQAERPFALTDKALLRLSIGLEDSADLIADLDRALKAYAEATP
ncbi:cystathionine beta-lyase [Massilia puerhi]|uniref:cystathionine beta-lyase n=1 Tax=Massilia puerhi TaxID=2681550 RepID=UPI001359B1C8|nr:cystathionine beta-lyase [Massilia puerhi]